MGGFDLHVAESPGFEFFGGFQLYRFVEGKVQDTCLGGAGGCIFYDGGGFAGAGYRIDPDIAGGADDGDLFFGEALVGGVLLAAILLLSGLLMFWLLMLLLLMLLLLSVLSADILLRGIQLPGILLPGILLPGVLAPGAWRGRKVCVVVLKFHTIRDEMG